MCTDLYFVSSSGHFGHVAHDVFSSNSFSSSAFTAETDKIQRAKIQTDKNLIITLKQQRGFRFLYFTVDFYRYNFNVNMTEIFYYK